MKTYGVGLLDNNEYPKAFHNALVDIVSVGSEVHPRGKLTKEILGATMIVDPKKSLYTSPIRDLNFFFLVAENLWYWSGRNSTEIPSSYVKRYREFSDQNLHQGAYGPMILEQIRYIVNCLESDPDSRQAVMTLWRPNPIGSKDTPCTLNFHFMIRNGELNMHATMRSNDIIWGSNYDIPSFSMILLAVAGILKAKPGKLFLTANSLHLYEEHFDLAYKLIEEKHCLDYLYPKNLMMLECQVDSLADHIEHIETLLTAHYVASWTEAYHAYNIGLDLPPFYAQFAYMIALKRAIGYEDKPTIDNSIRKLLDIKSPFGIIYNERLNKKL